MTRTKPRTRRGTGRGRGVALTPGGGQQERRAGEGCGHRRSLAGLRGTTTDSRTGHGSQDAARPGTTNTQEEQ